MTAIVLTLFAVPSSQASAPGGVLPPSGDTGAQRLVPRVTGAVHTSNALSLRVAPVTVREAAAASSPHQAAAVCPDNRRGIVFYRQRQRDWQSLRGVPSRIGRKPHGCADARYLASVARERASIARRAHERWQERRTLRDFAFADGNRAWPRAVEEVQRVFPGTEGWLLSCSAAEGGHGRWVGYGGQGYSTWLRDSDTVGGPLQFRYSTFTGMFRHALNYLGDSRYIVPRYLRDPENDRAWRSALGQALAGGWARYTGNDDSHWSASFGRGC